MPIRQLLDNAAFNLEDIVMLRGVFEDTLCAMNLSDRTDPVTTLAAKKIIELASQGASGGYQRVLRAPLSNCGAG
jgi:hypothetical protein